LYNGSAYDTDMGDGVCDYHVDFGIGSVLTVLGETFQIETMDRVLVAAEISTSILRNID